MRERKEGTERKKMMKEIKEKVYLERSLLLINPATVSQAAPSALSSFFFFSLSPKEKVEAVIPFLRYIGWVRDERKKERTRFVVPLVTVSGVSEKMSKCASFSPLIGSISLSPSFPILSLPLNRLKLFPKLDSSLQNVWKKRTTFFRRRIEPW